MYENEYKVHPVKYHAFKFVFSLDAHMETAEPVASALLYFKCNKCEAACFHTLFKNK